MTTRGAAIGMASVVLALTAGCASTGSSSTSGSSRTTTGLSSTTLAGLTRLAEQAASEQGAAVRSATVVRSTRRAANLALGGDIVNTDAGESVWAIVVVAKAPFVCRSCSAPAGAKPPQGTVITLVADAKSLTVVDSGIVDSAPDLASLGTPVSLPV